MAEKSPKKPQPSSDHSKSEAQLKSELKSLQISIADDKFRQQCEEDSSDGYWKFLTEVLGYKDLDESIHRPICDELTAGNHHKFLFLLPRGHLKSSVVTIGWAMWRVIQDSNRTIAMFNESESLVEEFLFEMRTHFEENLVLRKHWGHLVPEGKERKVWRIDALQLKRSRINRTPTLMAKSINESTAGRHPDAMILDDVISNQTVRTPAGIQKSLERFRELQALLEPPDAAKDPIKGTEIVIGTRWHYLDLYNTIKETFPHFFVMKRAAVEDGKVIFPQKFNKEILAEKLVEVKEWVYSSQYLNEPVDSENAVFTPGMIRKAMWRGSRAKFLEEIPCNIIMAIDPAWEGEDNFGIIVGCIDNVGKRRVLESKYCTSNPDSALNTAVTLIIRWGVQKVYFEAVGGQEWLRRNLVKLLEKNKIRVSVQPVSHGNRNKEMRILGLSPEIKYGRLFFHESNEDLVAELLHFPRGLNDLADACEIFSMHGAGPSLRGHATTARKSPGTGEFEIAALESGTLPNSGPPLPWEIGGHPKVWTES